MSRPKFQYFLQQGNLFSLTSKLVRCIPRTQDKLENLLILQVRKIFEYSWFFFKTQTNILEKFSQLKSEYSFFSCLVFNLPNQIGVSETPLNFQRQCAAAAMHILKLLLTSKSCSKKIFEKNIWKCSKKHFCNLTGKTWRVFVRSQCTICKKS